MNGMVISGEQFSGPDVVAGWGIFKKIWKVAKKVHKVAKKLSPLHHLGVHKLVKKYARPVLKYAAPALGMASTVMPWLAPAAVAAKMAHGLMGKIRKGKKAARFAMRMFGRSAKRGSGPSRMMTSWMKKMALRRSRRRRRPAPRRRSWGRGRWGAFARRFNPRMMRQMASMARRGNYRAAGTLQQIAGAADAGDPDCQHLLEAAAGTAHWDDGNWQGYHANHPEAVAGADYDIVPDTVDYQPSYDVVAGHTEVVSRAPVETEVVSGLIPGQAYYQTHNASGQTVYTPVVRSEYHAVAGHHYDVVAGGPVWDALKPQAPYRPDNAPNYWGSRDAYTDGLAAVPARGY